MSVETDHIEDLTQPTLRERMLDLVDNAHTNAYIDMQARIIAEELKLRKLFGEHVQMPNAPDLSDEVWNMTVQQAGMTFMPVLGFGYSEQRIQQIASGKVPSNLTKIFPTSYLEGMAKGQLPLPDRHSYSMLVDGEGESTSLTKALGIEGGLNSISFNEMERLLASNGDAALAAFGIDSATASIQVLTADKLLYLRHMHPELVNRTAVTATSVGTESVTVGSKSRQLRRESRQAMDRLGAIVDTSLLHVAVGKKIMATQSGDSRGMGPRLAIVFK